MTKLQKYLVAGVALIAVLGLFFPRVVTKLSGIQSGTDVTTTNFTTLSVSNGFSTGGIFNTGARIAFTTATTTVCAIQSPNATSTLVYGSAMFTVSSTSASTVNMARATTAFATTTSLGNGIFAANAQGTVIASTTPSSVATDGSQVFPPSTWFVVGMTGGTGTFSPTGYCSAEWNVN
jgi:hypothetical protein